MAGLLWPVYSLLDRNLCMRILTVTLSKYPDIDVEIYEGASSLAEVGAGIGLFPRKFSSAT